jgi:hypothetical protein
MKKLLALVTLLGLMALVVAACGGAAAPAASEQAAPCPTCAPPPEKAEMDLHGREILIGSEDAYPPSTGSTRKPTSASALTSTFGQMCGRLNCKPVWVRLGRGILRHWRPASMTSAKAGSPHLPACPEGRLPILRGMVRSSWLRPTILR